MYVWIHWQTAAAAVAAVVAIPHRRNGGDVESREIEHGWRRWSQNAKSSDMTKQNRGNANGSEWNEINMDKAARQPASQSVNKPATCLSSQCQVAYKYQSEINARSNSIYTLVRRLRSYNAIASLPSQAVLLARSLSTPTLSTLTCGVCVLCACSVRAPCVYVYVYSLCQLKMEWLGNVIFAWIALSPKKGHTA